jgi:hypothetical protein
MNGLQLRYRRGRENINNRQQADVRQKTPGRSRAQAGLSTMPETAPENCTPTVSFFRQRTRQFLKVCARGEKYSLNSSGGWPSLMMIFAPSVEMPAMKQGASFSPRPLIQPRGPPSVCLHAST